MTTILYSTTNEGICQVVIMTFLMEGEGAVLLPAKGVGISATGTGALSVYQGGDDTHSRRVIVAILRNGAASGAPWRRVATGQGAGGAGPSNGLVR